jgi:hypothetical protein
LQGAELGGAVLTSAEIWLARFPPGSWFANAGHVQFLTLTFKKSMGQQLPEKKA